MANSPIKIGIDARCLEGVRTGTGRYLSNLLKYFGTHKEFEFHLYFKREIPADAYFQEFDYKLKRLDPLFGHESNALFTHILLPRALVRDGIRMLFAPYYVAPWRCPIPYVLALHDISYEAHPEWTPPLDRFFLRTASRHSARRAAGIVTVSEFSKREIMRLYKIPDAHIAVTLLALDRDLARQDEAALQHDAVAKRFGVNGRYVVSVGTLINRRYPLTTLAAFAEVAKTDPDLELLFIGSDRTYPRLDMALRVKRTNALLKRTAVRILPHATDAELWILFCSASAFLWLSEYEGFGLPPLEAIAAGIPVITSDTSSIPEAVSDAAIRLPHRPDIPFVAGAGRHPGPAQEAVADALRRVLTDEHLRGELREKGAQWVRHMSWERTAEQTIDALSKALR